MLTVFSLVLALQQATGSAVWTDEAPATPPAVAAETRADLPDWAIADPFG